MKKVLVICLTLFALVACEKHDQVASTTADSSVVVDADAVDAAEDVSAVDAPQEATKADVQVMSSLDAPTID